MKSVLVSIQPKWCELIANGKKTVEVRKTKPKLDTPFKVYVYMTKAYDTIFGKGNPKRVSVGGGKVIGEFICDCIANYEAEFWADETFEGIQEFFEPDDFAEYGEYEYKTIADNGDDFWKENMLCQASCLTIEELRKYVGCGIATFYGWHISDLVIYDKPKELSEFYRKCEKFVCEGCEHLKYQRVNADEYDYECEFFNYHIPITRPPQGWCYVESQ